jgi:hypothetical protein
MSWSIRNDKENRELINALPTVKITELQHPYGIAQYDPFSWRPLSWLSKIIRRVRNSPVNHMKVVHWEEGRGLVTTEANEKGVVTNPLVDSILRYKDRGTLVVALIPVKNILNEEVTEKAKKERGKPYGFLSLLQFFWATIRRKPVRSKALRSGKVQVCSTLLVRLLTRSGSYWTYTPKEIWDSNKFIKKKVIL